MPAQNITKYRTKTLRAVLKICNQLHKAKKWCCCISPHWLAALATSPVSGQRQPITHRWRSCSWDVFPYDLFPNQLRPLGACFFDRSATGEANIPYPKPSPLSRGRGTAQAVEGAQRMGCCTKFVTSCNSPFFLFMPLCGQTEPAPARGRGCSHGSSRVPTRC